MRFAAIEGGGTSWVAAIVEDRPDNITERATFETRDPKTTLGEIKEWLSARSFDAIGVACFGPVDANPSSPTYGYITSTPKPGWANTNVLGLLGVQALNLPFKFDTDVNAPAFAEYSLQDQTKASSCAYITVGTGVGVGLVVNGATVRGMMHPEGGHIQVARKDGDLFHGHCPYHSSCIEGMCASGALAARKQIPAADLKHLPDDDDVWDSASYYLAQLCVTLILIASPECITFGGGIMQRQSLYPKIRNQVRVLLNDYIRHSSIMDDTKLDAFIRPSHWGANAGIVGAAFLAQLALNEVTSHGAV